jgi:hypothetical protein
MHSPHSCRPSPTPLTPPPRPAPAPLPQVQLSGPLVRTSFATSASVEVRSPKLLQVQFREGRVATPELLQDVALPASLEVLGQRVDLAPLQVGPYKMNLIPNDWSADGRACSGVGRGV